MWFPGVNLWPGSPGDLPDIDVAARVHRETVRRQEFAKLDSGRRVTEAGNQLAFMIDNTDARPEVRNVTADGGGRADLRKANLRGAGLRGAWLDEADLRDARLGSAFLVEASLRGADLRGAYLRLAKLDGADLSDADLGGADGLTQHQLDRAHCNPGTKLPAGLTGVQDAKR